MFNDCDEMNERGVLKSKPRFSLFSFIVIVLAAIMIVMLGYIVIEDGKVSSDSATASTITADNSVTTPMIKRALVPIPNSYGYSSTTGSALFYDSMTYNVYIRAYPDTHNGVGIAQYTSTNGNPYRYNIETGELEEYIPEYIQIILDKLDISD